MAGPTVGVPGCHLAAVGTAPKNSVLLCGITAGVQALQPINVFEADDWSAADDKDATELQDDLAVDKPLRLSLADVGNEPAEERPSQERGASDGEQGSAAEGEEGGGDSASAIATKLSNPVGDSSPG